MLKLDTGGLPRLRLVKQAKRSLNGVYGMGRIVQIDARHAAVIANVRNIDSELFDFEDGSDAVPFSRLEEIVETNATTLSTNETMANPKGGQPFTIVRYPSNVALMPADAPLPGAGTGFGLACTMGFDPITNRLSSDVFHGIEVQQLRLEGTSIRVVHSEVLQPEALVQGWRVVNVGMGGPLLEGQTFWMCAVAERVPTVRESGLLEWQFDGRKWCVKSFIPITDGGTWFEPSVIQDVKGRWIACARGIGNSGGFPGARGTLNPHAEDVVLWSAPGPRGPWMRVLTHGPVRSQTPLTVARVPGGVAVLGSPRHEPKTYSNGFVEPSIWMRQQLVAWPIDPDNNWQVGPPVTLFDCDQAMGKNPGRWDWRADHPFVATVTLADGRTHTLLVWRTCDCEEVDGKLPPTPWSGLWVGELTHGS
jgi:hypothetical protein